MGLERRSGRALVAAVLATAASGSAQPGGPVVGWGAAPPAAVDGTEGGATAVAAGGTHSCAIQVETGNVVCWGADFFGQCPG